MSDRIESFCGFQLLMLNAWSLINNGIRYANVFPEPVGEMPSISDPNNAAGMP